MTNPSTGTLRQFAALWLLVFGGLATWQGLAVGGLAFGGLCALLAIGVGLTGLVKPEAVRPVFVGAQRVTFPIHWVVSHFLLAALFYGLFTPVGLLFRFLGRDALALRRRTDRESYWVPRPATTDMVRYLQQF